MRSARFWLKAGFELPHMDYVGIWTADEVSQLIRDTALHTPAVLPEFEASVGKTVLTAHQVTMWEALRLLMFSYRRLQGQSAIIVWRW